MALYDSLPLLSLGETTPHLGTFNSAEGAQNFARCKLNRSIWCQVARDKTVFVVISPLLLSQNSCNDGGEKNHQQSYLSSDFNMIYRMSLENKTKPENK